MAFVRRKCEKVEQTGKKLSVFDVYTFVIKLLEWVDIGKLQLCSKWNVLADILACLCASAWHCWTSLGNVLVASQQHYSNILCLIFYAFVNSVRLMKSWHAPATKHTFPNFFLRNALLFQQIHSRIFTISAFFNEETRLVMLWGNASVANIRGRYEFLTFK